MAETVLFNIADGIIRKLGSLAMQEFKLWWDVKDELDKLNRSVSMIKAVLLDAEEKSMQSNQVKTWLGMINEVIYDADDLVDEFSTKALQHQAMTGNKMTKEVRKFFSTSNQLAYGLKMAHKIKDMRERLDEIAANRKFSLEERSVETVSLSKTSREQTHSSTPEVVVGRANDKEKIVDLLLSSSPEENVSAISIVGIGGLGKTALAQFVYSDEKLDKHFDVKAWACISDNFDVESAVKKIIESVSGEEPRNREMDPLKNLLHDKINGRKFLIVLDDLWSDDSHKWFRLKDLLAGGARGSKVIVTTRLKKVAEMTRPIYIHELQGLSETESWSLFKQMAFKPGQLPSLSFETIGKEIVAKCLGVPLAIKTIGGLFYFKESESEWVAFHSKQLSRVEQSENDILPTLKLSYNHLPSHLKHCFAYCSLYPKDTIIDVERLIRYWVALGFVKSSDENQCLYDIGVEYFMDLLQMSFFQEVRKDVYGVIRTCKMHDLMHDLAMLVSGDDCVNSENSCISDKARHVSVEFDGKCDWRAFPSLLKANKARTLWVSGNDIKEEQLDEIFCNLRYLRVLVLSDLSIQKVSRSISKLKHLRYLDLSWNKVKALPDSITMLQNLQVLDLAFNAIETIPHSVTKLKNLQVLKFEPGNFHLPRGIGQLTCLQNLPEFYADVEGRSGGIGELHALNNLRGGLSIGNLRYVKNGAFEFKQANLKEKQHIRRLHLNWGIDGTHDEDVIKNDEMALEALQPHQNLKALVLRNYGGVKVSSWISLLMNLVSIQFRRCENIQRLPPLDKLPFLKSLKILELHQFEYIEIKEDLNDQGSVLFFPSLEELRIDDCPNLKGFVRFKIDGGIMPLSSLSPCFQHLSQLTILNCPNLILMPPFPFFEFLKFGNDNLKSLKDMLSATSQSASSVPPSTSPFSALSQLKIISLYQTDDLLPELLQNLTSLQELSFCDCPTRKSLSSEDEDDGMHWQGLKSLHSLSFNSTKELVSLPKGLQFVTTLRTLDILFCPNLTSLPQWMVKLNSLQTLYISKCPQLSERCNNNMAEDWPNIDHIANISVDDKTIQRNGCYQL